ncbi:MAG: putative molybdenum carrier protein [Candidatus Competibacteraceae bacterium]|nr:putative molybdenum carrier protein [Candidatus Competibacteraceae bacterium]
MAARLEKLISGGQTGVDRAALDAALEVGIEIEGWCPKRRRAEDGTIPERYPLTETPERGYRARTRRNVEDADGTLVLNWGPLDGGTALTVRHARQAGKPCLVVQLEDGLEPAVFRAWLADHSIGVLNVAGPREGKRPGVHAAALTCLTGLLRAVLDGGRDGAAAREPRP